MLRLFCNGKNNDILELMRNMLLIESERPLLRKEEEKSSNWQADSGTFQENKIFQSKEKILSLAQKV